MNNIYMDKDGLAGLLNNPASAIVLLLLADTHTKEESEEEEESISITQVFFAWKILQINSI